MKNKFGKIVSVVLLISFLLLIALFASACDEDEDASIALTKDNYENYINVTLQFEDYSTNQEQASPSFTQYTSTAFAKITVSKNGNYQFESCKITFSISVLPFSAKTMIIGGTELLIDYDGTGETKIQVSASSLSSQPTLPVVTSSSLRVTKAEGNVIIK